MLATGCKASGFHNVTTPSPGVARARPAEVPIGEVGADIGPSTPEQDSAAPAIAALPAPTTTGPAANDSTIENAPTTPTATWTVQVRPKKRPAPPIGAATWLTPLTGGLALFVGTYGLTAAVALAQAPDNGVLFIPVAGPFITVPASFRHAGSGGSSSFIPRGTGDFLAGVAGLVDGVAQALGITLVVVGLLPKRESGVASLAPAKPFQVAVRPLASAQMTGLGLTISSF
jgi:hypothetical protein